MPRLFRVLLLIALACLALPAAAAERVLLRAAGQNATAGDPPLAASVSGLRAKARTAGKIRVIVGLKVPFAPSASLSPAAAGAQATEIAAAAAQLRSRFAAIAARGDSALRTYASIPFAAMQVTPQELDRLAADPSVLSIVEDGQMKLSLAKSVPFIRADSVWSAGQTGAGQAIAIIDTGVDKNHPFLKDKVVSEACFTQDYSCPEDTAESFADGSGLPCSFAECEHGTHVAGIAAGKETPNFNASGVAKDAKLIAIRVFYRDATGQPTAAYSDIIAALDRVYALATSADPIKVAAVNMSLGNGFFVNSCDAYMPAMTTSVQQLVARGIAVVAASGNEYQRNAIAFPACVSGVISVGSVSDDAYGPCRDKSGRVLSSFARDRVDCYSNGSPILSLLAPGTYIASSLPGGAYGYMSGTSMAAPHVAGAFALLRNAAPDATVAELLQVVKTSGRPIGDWRNPRTVTSRIDVKAALDRINAVSADPTLPLNVNIAGSGRGTVSFTPAGTERSCVTTCSSRYAKDTIVTLTATPDRLSLFSGWSGPCTITGAGECRVTLSAALSVTATFYRSATAPQTLTVTVAPGGTSAPKNAVEVWIKNDKLDCSTGCSVLRGTTVKLLAVPRAGDALSSWSSVCAGKKNVCIFKMDRTAEVTATFAALPVYSVSYTKAGSGSGNIEMSVDGGAITTPASGSTASLPSGTTVRVVARPASGVHFDGWSGGLCRGLKRVCAFMLRSNVQINATFN